MKPLPVRLYDFPFSGNGYKVRLALAQLGQAVDYEVVDLIAGETRAPEFLAINPMGQVPVLELADGTRLTESNAILWWLTEGTPLAPGDALGRARATSRGTSRSTRTDAERRPPAVRGLKPPPPLRAFDGLNAEDDGTMTWEAALKTLGYLISTISVVCLGVVSWEGAKDKPLLFFLLLAGMAASVGGMLLRWIALLVKQHEEKALVAKAAHEEVQHSLNVEIMPTARRR